jgi:Ca-activated chloride channel family protein
VYPKGSFDLFAGEQLVLVGRYRKFGTAKVVVTGSVAGKKQKLDFPAKFVKKSKDETHAFIEKLWAVRRVGEILDELDLKGKNDELVTELVQLSKRHGILTPYTSFMADDTGRVDELAQNVRRAGERLGALDRASGAGGFLQRSLKSEFRSAARAPSASEPAARPLMDAFSRQNGAVEAAKAAGLDYAEEVANEAEAAFEKLRNVGNRTFYWRDGRWRDSKVTKEQEKNVTRVKQFSDDYFDLAARHGKKMSQYMVFDEPVLIYLEGRAYLIEP